MSVVVLGTPPVLDLLAVRAIEDSDLEGLCVSETPEDDAERRRRLENLGLILADGRRLNSRGRAAADVLELLVASGAVVWGPPAPDDGGGGTAAREPAWRYSA